MRTSIQVSDRLRRRLERRKEHPRQPYEEVIEAALGAVERPLGLPPLASEAADAIAEVVPRLRVLYGSRLVRIVLYGSHARGDARPDSDVDLLLVLQGSVDRASEIERVVEVTYDVLLRRGVHVSVLPVCESDFLTRASPLLITVRREGWPL